MTNYEFYTRAKDVIDDYISYVKVDSQTMAYYASVAAHIGVILVECSSHHIPRKECLFIIRHHFSYKTSYESTIKDAYRHFYRVLRRISMGD